MTTRRFETSIDLDATPDVVWKALTDPAELVRWFPFEAAVRPGEGGEMRWAWGERFSWITRIDAWQPGRRLLLAQDSELPFDLAGRPLGDGAAPPARIAIEITLESRGAKSRLRLVHSGFGPGAAWDDELASISHGWQGELRSLRHYLAKHHGKDRQAAWAFRTTTLPPRDALARLTSTEGFLIDVSTLAPGLPWRVVTPWGEILTGDVVLALPDGEIAGTAREANDGFLRLHAWRAGGETGVGAWFATWGEAPERTRDFERQASAALVRLFP